MAGPFSHRSWKERCSILEARLTGHKAVDEASLRLWRPGGSSNPGKGVQQWFAYYTWLVRVDERALATSASQTSGSAEMERQLIEVVRGTPRRVELIAPWPTPAGEVKSVLVYPKGLVSLLEADSWDAEIQTLAPWVNVLKASKTAADADLALKAQARLTTAQGALIWIATSGQGDCTAACPYRPELIVDVEVPPWYADADPYDVVRLLRAFADLNAGRLALVSSLTRLKFSGLPAPDFRPSWATFMSEQALATGIPVSELADRWPLTALVAQAALRGIADHERHERAKQEAEANRPK